VGYAVSQRIRKRIEEAFGWGKTVGTAAKTMLRGTARVGSTWPPIISPGCQNCSPPDEGEGPPCTTTRSDPHQGIRFQLNALFSSLLVERGLLEGRGNLLDIRGSEVRLPTIGRATA
jgi:hypothetical protein